MGVAVGHNKTHQSENTPLQANKSDFAFQTKRIQSEPFQKVVSGTKKALHSRTVGLNCLLLNLYLFTQPFLVDSLLIFLSFFFPVIVICIQHIIIFYFLRDKCSIY